MTFVNFGHYAYRAWAARDHMSTGPWEAWYEIHTPDHLTLLSGPTKLSQEFSSGEEAREAAESEVQKEISQSVVGQTAPSADWKLLRKI
jgi:hypothetical protein